MLANNVPEGVEVLFRKEQKPRTPDQNSLMWSCQLRDISEQAWIEGRRFSDVVWHEYFKREYLPEEYEEGITKENYAKWDYTPDGERVLVGSTTNLTKRGFSIYLQKIEAHGANLGVQFGIDERRFA